MSFLTRPPYDQPALQIVTRRLSSAEIIKLDLLSIRKRNARKSIARIDKELIRLKSK